MTRTPRAMREARDQRSRAMLRPAHASRARRRGMRRAVVRGGYGASAPAAPVVPQPQIAPDRWQNLELALAGPQGRVERHRDFRDARAQVHHLEQQFDHALEARALDDAGPVAAL